MTEIWTGAGKAGKNKGLFLTLMLYLTFFGTFINIVWNLFAGVLLPTVSDSEFRPALIMIIFSILAFVSIYGMWNLKKWGLFLNIILTLGLIFIDYLLTGKISILDISLILFSSILLYIAVFRKWKLFN